MWPLKVVTSHSFGYLCNGVFSDSEVVKAFYCGEKECTYVACHGLGPLFSFNSFICTVGDVTVTSSCVMCLLRITDIEANRFSKILNLGKRAACRGKAAENTHCQVLD